jgi:hypothetical protein
VLLQPAGVLLIKLPVLRTLSQQVKVPDRQHKKSKAAQHVNLTNSE